MRATSVVELFGTSRLDGGRVACSAWKKQPLAADAATAFSDAKEMGRLLRSQGASVEPLAVSDTHMCKLAAAFGRPNSCTFLILGCNPDFT